MAKFYHNYCIAFNTVSTGTMSLADIFTIQIQKMEIKDLKGQGTILNSV